jgi:poly(A) polymerase
MTDAFSHAKTIVTRLVRQGFIAYFAGGWVRDFVMGHPSEDIDIATNASPAEIMDLFPQTVLVGLAFGVVIVVIEGHQYEVATFRKDLRYIDGRHPVGIEMSNPFEDAKRRDFTINGMFYDPLDNIIHDYVQGQEDIRHGVIRAIGDPYERFFEDRLRMLRAFRFGARFSFSIEPNTQEAIRENAHQLFPAVAMERVWQEFNKMVAYPGFDQAIVEMHRSTLLDVIFPEIIGMHIKDLREIVKNFSLFPSECPTILYLMEIMRKVPFLQKIEIAKRLKSTNKDLKLLEFMELLEQAVVKEAEGQPCDAYTWTKLFARLDWKQGLQILALRYHDKDAESFLNKYGDRYKQLEPHVLRMRAGKPLVTAELLQKNGISPGKKMGVLLKEAEKISANEDCATPEAVLEKLRQLNLWKEALCD